MRYDDNQTWRPRPGRGQRHHREGTPPGGGTHEPGGPGEFGSGGFGPGGFGPGGFGPGGFGPGGFGPGGFGPGRRGPGGRGRRGQVRQAILALLAEKPFNGYQVMQELAQRTGGLWRPSPGAVYPALNQLEDENLIESFDNEGQKAFRLTEAGQTAAAGQPQAPWDVLDRSFGDRDPDAIRSLWAEFGSLAAAGKELSRHATTAQLTQAGQIVAEARRKLYGLLAAEPESTTDLR